MICLRAAGANSKVKTNNSNNFIKNVVKCKYLNVNSRSELFYYEIRT